MNCFIDGFGVVWVERRCECSGGFLYGGAPPDT